MQSPIERTGVGTRADIVPTRGESTYSRGNLRRAFTVSLNATSLNEPGNPIDTVGNAFPTGQATVFLLKLLLFQIR